MMKTMIKLKYFEGFDPETDRKTDRKTDKPIRNIDNFTKGGRCQGKCDRTIIRTKEGPKIVCLGCKRIIN